MQNGFIFIPKELNPPVIITLTGNILIKNFYINFIVFDFDKTEYQKKNIQKKYFIISRIH